MPSNYQVSVCAISCVDNKVRMHIVHSDCIDYLATFQTQAGYSSQTNPSYVKSTTKHHLLPIRAGSSTPKMLFYNRPDT